MEIISVVHGVYRHAFSVISPLFYGRTGVEFLPFRSAMRVLDDSRNEQIQLKEEVGTFRLQRILLQRRMRSAPDDRRTPLKPGGFSRVRQQLVWTQAAAV